jgi:hypothetical protein
LPPLRYGYNQEQDVLYTLADGTPSNELWNEFSDSLALYNETRDRLIDILTYPVSNWWEPVANIGDVDDFEPASEFGQPRGIRTATGYRSVGYSFRWYDLATRFTWRYLQAAAREQIESVHNAVLEADRKNVFREILRAAFTKENGVVSPMPTNVNMPPVTVYRFFNADGWVPDTYKTNTFAGTHQHYLGTGTAQLDPQDVEDAENHLRHHGHEDATYILLVNRVESLRIQTFVKGVNAAIYDFIPSQQLLPWLFTQANIAVGQVPAAPPAVIGQHPGFVGTYGRWNVVEEDWVPAGYLFGFASGGAKAIVNPIAYRESDNAALRGLLLAEGPRADYPLIDSFYQRGFGTGVRYRSAGVLLQVVASATYTTPTIT